MSFPFRLTLFVFVLLLACTSFTAASAAQAQERPLAFSLVPKKDVDRQLAELQPLLQLLEDRLQRPIKLIRPNSYQAVIEGLLAQTIDFGILGPASYAHARARDERIDAFASFSRKQGAVTPAGSFYQSILLALKKAGVARSSELQGKIVAMTDPASTSGSLIPRVEFGRQIGMPLDEFFAKQVYAGSHDRAIKSLLSGQVDAAFVSSNRIEEAIREGQVELKHLIFLWRSQPIHRDPFVFGSSLDESLRNQIRDAMLRPSGKLKEMFRDMEVNGIIPVKNSDYQTIHEIVALQQR